MSDILQYNRYTVESFTDYGLRLAFISDVHGCFDGLDIKRIKAFSPDITVIGGDFVNGAAAESPGALSLIKNLSEFSCVFYTPGNHDTVSPDGEKTLAGAGAVCLLNGYIKYKDVLFGGLLSGFTDKQNAFMKTPAPDTGFIDRFSALEGYKVLISHHPEYYDKYLRTKDIDLILSGHAHGGQWRISGRGVFAPGQGIFPKYTSGIHDGRLAVSRGIGNLVRIPRLNNPPEVIFLGA